MQIVYDTTTGELEVLDHPEIDTERDTKIAKLIHQLPSKTGIIDADYNPATIYKSGYNPTRDLCNATMKRMNCMSCCGAGHFDDVSCPVCKGAGEYAPLSAAHGKDIDIIRRESEANERLREKIGKSLGKSDVEVKSDIYRPRKSSKKTHVARAASPFDPYDWASKYMGRNGK